jgi:hypothetical protein
VTCILRNIKDQEVYYFDDSDELYDWVNENINHQDRNYWEMIDDEGQVFYV